MRRVGRSSSVTAPCGSRTSVPGRHLLTSLTSVPHLGTDPLLELKGKSGPPSHSNIPRQLMWQLGQQDMDVLRFPVLKVDTFLSSFSPNKCANTPSLEQPCVCEVLSSIGSLCTASQAPLRLLGVHLWGSHGFCYRELLWDSNARRRTDDVSGPLVYILRLNCEKVTRVLQFTTNQV